jgi:hypothetical protein
VTSMRETGKPSGSGGERLGVAIELVRALDKATVTKPSLTAKEKEERRKKNELQRSLTSKLTEHLPLHLTVQPFVEKGDGLREGKKRTVQLPGEKDSTTSDNLSRCPPGGHYRCGLCTNMPRLALSRMAEIPFCTSYPFRQFWGKKGCAIRGASIHWLT